MRIWTLKLEREQEGYFRNFLGPSIEGPGPIEVVEKSEYDTLAARVQELEDKNLKALEHGCELYNEVQKLEYELQRYKAANEVMREAHESISKNGCCDTCQEAKLWSLKALREAAAILETQTKEKV